MTDKKPENSHAPIGRPSIYTEELADRICMLVATNTCGLDALCAKYPDLPVSSTIKEWRWSKDSFSARYAKAKMYQAELMAEEIIELSKEKLMYHDAEGNQRVDSGSVASQRLQVDSAKWIAAKLAPKVYGERKVEEPKSNEETLSKIKDLVADLNKTNASDV